MTITTTSDIPLFPTYEETGGILGGGATPYSVRTIERLVAAGRLLRVGRGANRRIVGKSLRELIAKLENGMPLWPDEKRQRVARRWTKNGQAISYGTSGRRVAGRAQKTARHPSDRHSQCADHLFCLR